MTTAAAYLDTLSNTYDDDVATDAVEGLIALGPAAVPALREFLTMEGFTSAGNCDKGERLSYVLKALDGIGDGDSWKPALELFVAFGGLNNSNFASNMELLFKFAKAVDPDNCADLPSSPNLPNLYDPDERAQVLDQVKTCLSSS